jgi:hydrogenase maturation protease
VVTGAAAGHITWWDAEEAPIRMDSFRRSTHALGVAEAIELARALNRLPSRLRIYGIEGRRFDPGAVPSPEVAAAVEAVTQQIANEVVRS